MLRILFINPYFLPYRGGIERVIEKLSAEFLKSGDVEKVGVLTTKYEFPRKYRSDFKDFEIINNIEVYRVDSIPKTAPPFYQVPLVWIFPQDFKRIIEKFNPDVIQLMTDRWFWGNFWSWWYGRRQAKIIFSLSFHGLGWGLRSNPLSFFLKQLLRPINILLTNASNGVHAVSQVEKKMIKKSYLTCDHKFFVAPWGVDTAKEDILGCKKDGREVVILCVGRLSKHKGQIWLLERYIRCLKRFKRPTSLIFIGKDEGEQKCLESRIKDTGLRDNIKLVGEVSDKELEKWYKKGDLFAMFPEYEAFGLVFLEAMGRGLPVITHRVGALPEILDKAGILVNKYHKAEAENSLVELVNNRGSREGWRRLAYQYVKDTYSWEKTSSRFLEIYQSNKEAGF